MINFNNDINDNFIKTISEDKLEDFVVSDDHKMNMFYMGMVLSTGKQINILNDTESNLYQNIYDYWNNKYSNKDYLSSNNNDSIFIIAPSDYINSHKDTIKEEISDYKVYFSNRNTDTDLSNFDYKTCIDNMEKIGESGIVAINYDKNSITNFLELGVVYVLDSLCIYSDRRFVLWNKGISLDENNFGDRVIIDILEYLKDKPLIKKLNNNI